MNTFILVLAVIGWTLACVFFILFVLTSLVLGAVKELPKEQNASTVDVNAKTNAKIWSMRKEKEIPFGD